MGIKVFEYPVIFLESWRDSLEIRHIFAGGKDQCADGPLPIGQHAPGVLGLNSSNLQLHHVKKQIPRLGYLLFW